jgi:glutamate 5-kinase
MASKVLAARLAASVGVTTIISHSSQPENICSIIEGAGYHGDSRQSFETAVQAEYARDCAGTLHPVSMLGSERKIPTHTRFLSKGKAVPDRYLRLLDGLRGYSLLQ